MISAAEGKAHRNTASAKAQMIGCARDACQGASEACRELSIISVSFVSLAQIINRAFSRKTHFIQAHRNEMI